MSGTTLRDTGREWASSPAQGFALAACLLLAPSAWGDDVIVLRPQSALKGKTVAGFDEDGVRVEGMMRPFGWDDIAGGTVGRDQERFDRLLREVGEPLFQIRQGLRAGDYREVLGPAEALFPRYAARRSATAYMVAQALMWARLAHGKREGAVEPYLACVACLAADRERPPLPGPRRLRWDRATGLSPELPPLWFDREAAAAALPGVQKMAAALGPTAPPGVFLYPATLAQAAGDFAAADGYLARVGDAPRAVGELARVVRARQQIDRGQVERALPALEVLHGTASEANRPLVTYTLGLARVARGDESSRRDGVLDLLSVAALHGEDQPDLAAAALDQARRTLLDLRDADSARKLGDELLRAFPDTYHGAKLKAERAPADRPPTRER